MRPDMSKLIVERRRVGGDDGAAVRGQRRKIRQTLRDADRDTEVDPESFRGMKRLHALMCRDYLAKKELNENLKPLFRFLARNAGRPWDDVYGELMAHISLSNAVQYHVYQHVILQGMVATKTWIEHGRLMHHGGRGPEPIKGSPVAAFYVDPTDGSLRRNVEWGRLWRWVDRAARSKIRPVRRRSGQTPSIEAKIQGVWYRFDLRKAAEHAPSDLNRQDFRVESDSSDMRYLVQIAEAFGVDFSTRELFKSGPSDLSKRLFGDHLLPFRKRQLSTKEIKRLEQRAA